MTPGISLNTAMSKPAAPSDQNMLDSIMLYKGLDQARTNGLFDESGSIVKIYKLFTTSSPTDFLGYRSGYYFVVD
jgi:hypothetical protein